MPALFTPFKLKDVTLRNRIAVPPMCQYSAIDGITNDWHQVHYPSMARGGAGLVIVEATAVSAEGRITPACAGLWNDTQAEGMARIAKSIKAACNADVTASTIDRRWAFHRSGIAVGQ
ncbi:hypothetical protein KUC91_10240 [Pseudomonas aeruginosa]|nr:hypothetical protein [Pseudomonas aeruginosa]HCT8898536.1 hypothetical protein [Pseudomonas aeruginosa]